MTAHLRRSPVKRLIAVWLVLRSILDASEIERAGTRAGVSDRRVTLSRGSWHLTRSCARTPEGLEENIPLESDLRPSAAWPKLFERDELACQQRLDIREIQVGLVGSLVYQYEGGELMGTQHHRLLDYRSILPGGLRLQSVAASLAVHRLDYLAGASFLSGERCYRASMRNLTSAPLTLQYTRKSHTEFLWPLVPL